MFKVKYSSTSLLLMISLPFGLLLFEVLVEHFIAFFYSLYQQQTLVKSEIR